MKNNDFAIFILTHGRPDNQITYKTLINKKYNGKLYFIIDNEDKSADRYKELYGDKVIMFDKLAISKTFDQVDNFDDRRSIVYARNACFDIARELGIKYFMELDDDYTSFQYRKIFKKHITLTDINPALDALLEYYINSPFHSIAMAQGGDFIGGVGSSIWTKNKRKAMNSFICSTDRQFTFIGRINEDVNTYVKYGSIGFLFASIKYIMLNQKETQSNAGGMTDIYLDNGTYIKSFYTVMINPSCVKIGLMGDIHKRIHHNIKWINAVPVIISEDFKKQKPRKEESRQQLI